jgi:hypothetical protein
MIMSKNGSKSIFSVINTVKNIDLFVINGVYPNQNIIIKNKSHMKNKPRKKVTFQDVIYYDDELFTHNNEDNYSSKNKSKKSTGYRYAQDLFILFGILLIASAMMYISPKKDT